MNPLDLIVLTNSFIHIQGIGAITEKRLWESGIRDWDSISSVLPIPISAGRQHFLLKGIEDSKKHLTNRNPSYFSNLFPSNHCWRLFPEFRDSTAYLDIETTGLDRHFNKITTIALYDGQAINTYVQGQNLDEFIEDIQKYEVIVSYNGKSFDVPFIENYFNSKIPFKISVRIPSRREYCIFGWIINCQGLQHTILLTIIHLPEK